MQFNNLNLLIVQPIIPTYRKSFFLDLSKQFGKTVVISSEQKHSGFETVNIANVMHKHSNTIGNKKILYYQTGIIYFLLSNKLDSIFIAADFRALHYWLVLLVAKALDIPLFSHGQGLYNKPNPSLFQRAMFKIAISLSSQYICYNEFSRQSLLNIGIDENKLFVMDNTIVNKTPVTPENKTQITQRLFYLGRLREGCNLQLLFSALSQLKHYGYSIGLDILGDGTQRTELEKTANSLSLDIKFYGAVYDDQVISDISLNASMGIYPGDAGLSIVHYMSLSLIPIVHEDVTKHMGPEPSYVINGENGITFKRNNADSLALSIKYILDNPDAGKSIAFKAYQTYISLSSPTMAEKLVSAMKPFLNTRL